MALQTEKFFNSQTACAQRANAKDDEVKVTPGKGSAAKRLTKAQEPNFACSQRAKLNQPTQMTSEERVLAEI